MDFISYLPDKESISHWLMHYGSFSLFCLLALGIIALPVPEETLMVIAGILIRNGKLEAIPTMLAAYAGSMCGITVSYLFGRTAGRYLLIKYGSWVGLTEERLDQMHKWFESYGKWTLFFGYFIPGVRHFTGVAAGTSYLSYPSFALFAYVGAIFWVSTFLGLGYVLGDYWYSVYEYLDPIADKILLVVFMVIVVFLAYKYVYKPRTKNP